MKVVEILELAEKTLKMLQESCIKVEDVRFLPLYRDYADMCNKKKTYVVRYLSEKYKISERKVYYLIKKLSKDCKSSAVR